MTDDDLNHLCVLASIKIEAMERISWEDWSDEMMDASHHDLKMEWTAISILAKACKELMSRQGIKPKFRVRAATEPCE